MFVGQSMAGGVESTIRTTKLHVPALPDKSIAVQTTLLVPNRNAVPEGGTQATDNEPPAESTAVTLNKTGVSPPSHSIVTDAGHVSEGGGSAESTLEFRTVRDSSTTAVRAGKYPWASKLLGMVHRHDSERSEFKRISERQSMPALRYPLRPAR
jgi:hypothetical protein